MLKIFFALIFSTQITFADKKDFRVFDLKKTLPLTEKEETYYDYYISMGEDNGVKEGSTLNIYRRVPLVDNYRIMNHEDMQVAVAQLKVIYVQKTMCIGRMIKRKRPENMPVLEFEKIMVGDRADIADEKLPEPVVKAPIAPAVIQPTVLQEAEQSLPVKKVETKEIAEAPTDAPLPIQDNIIVNGAQD